MYSPNSFKILLALIHLPLLFLNNTLIISLILQKKKIIKTFLLFEFYKTEYVQMHLHSRKKLDKIEILC